MLRFGIIGLNEGNGHPYSFSAIFNGYDESRLEECPYAAIRAYLPAIHQNRCIIPDARGRISGHRMKRSRDKSPVWPRYPTCAAITRK